MRTAVLKGGTDMKYIYTQANCPKCESLKSGLIKQGILFKERPAERLQNRTDQIDVDGFIKLQMQNLTLPVEVDILTADDPVDESWDA